MSDFAFDVFCSEFMKDKKEKETDPKLDWDSNIWLLTLMVILFTGYAPKENHSFDKDYIQYLSGKLDAYKEILKGDI